MHEASVMAGLMRRIEAIAAAEAATRIVRVSVRLGALSHMTAGHFAEHFAQAAAGTVAEDAELDLTVSDETHDPSAHEIVLESVEIET